MYGAGILRELAEIAQRVGPSMESRMYGIQMEIKGFRVCAVLGFCANSLKLHRELAPVWRAKCMEFIRKMMDFMCVCGAEILRELAEIAQRVGPRMESKMYGIHK